MKTCKQCLLPKNYPQIEFDSKGVCNYCRREQFFGVEKKKSIQLAMASKHDLANQFEACLNEVRGKYQYDCLLLLSGGKDSTYLLYLLKEVYKLNPLTLFIDTGLISQVAKNNIQKIITGSSCDNLQIKPEKEFFIQLYRYYLLHPTSQTYSDSICAVCSNVIHSIGLKEAVKRNIPLIMLGYSPDQTDHFFYEIPKDTMNQSWIPPQLQGHVNQEYLNRYFWTPNHSPAYPQFYLPLHVLRYPSSPEMTKRIKQWLHTNNLDLSSQHTNCHLVWLLDYLDLRRFGYIPYVQVLSKNIQHGTIKNTYLTRFYYKMGLQLLKIRIYKRKSMNLAMRHLGISLSEIQNRD